MFILTQKKCSKCGETKPVTEFHKQSKSRDGLRSQCKSCVLDYQHNPANKTRHNSYMQEYHKKTDVKEKAKVYNAVRHPVYYKNNAERIKEKTRLWSINNRERKLEYDRQYRENNKEKIKEGFKDWAKRNYHVIKAHLKNRKARIKNAEGKFSGKQWKALIEYYCPDGACLCCGQVEKLTPDHVVPLANSGTNYIGNIQPLCGKCNRSKWMKDTDYRPDKGEYARRLQNG